MKRPGPAVAVSILINFLLAGWLVNNYLHDPYFASYVNLAIAPIIPYLVLTIGIGCGSSLGYLLLRKKHSGASLSERLQKNRPAKPIQLPGPTGTTLQSKSTPVGAPPGPTSKHTAYAVPPLPKSSTPSGQKPSPAPSWSMSNQSTPPSLAVQRPEQRTINPMSLKQTAPTPSVSRLEPPSRSTLNSQTSPSSGSEPSNKQFPRFQEGPEIGARQSQSSSPSFQSFRTESPSGGVQNLGNLAQESSRLPPTPRPTTDTAGKTGMGAQWRPESSGNQERKSETPNFYSRPFPEDSRPSVSGQPPGLRQPSPQGSTTGFQSPKTQPSDQGSRPSEWTNPVPKQGYTPPQKWAPPSVSPVPTNRPPPTMGQNTRPGQAPPGRPFAPAQGAPRPLTYPGLMRTPPGGGGTATGAFRPDQARPQGTTAQQPSTSATQRPSPPQWTQSAGERKDTPTSPGQPPTSSLGRSPSPPQSPALPEQGERGSPGGEMDWDTALDTILKTLRKDKVDDKP